MNLNFKRDRTPTSLLALAFDGSRLEGVVLRRANGATQTPRLFEATLALNPLTDEADLVGREILNQLQKHEVRERRCLVCIPLQWAVTLQVRVPNLPQADIQPFLEIEAERGLPYAPDAVRWVASSIRLASGERLATLAAVPKANLDALEAALRAARLIPVSFTLGITALHPASLPGVALSVGQNHIDLQVTASGGVAALRALEHPSDAPGGTDASAASSALVAREIRITLGQLGAPLRDEIKTIRVYGRGETARRFAVSLKDTVAPLGLSVEHRERVTGEEYGRAIAPGSPITEPLAAAVDLLSGRRTEFQLLAPRVSPIQQFVGRFSSRKLAGAGFFLAAAGVLLLLAFLVQQIQLSYYRSQWKQMEARVKQVEETRQQVRRFRPWYDESFRALSILRKLSDAFPEEGSVSAKSIEIRDLATISCSGVTADNNSLIRTLERLRANPEVSAVKTDHIRDGTPLQFTFNFRWESGGANGR
jgi:hypothetical protein